MRVMTKGKPVLINRPVQKLYLLELRAQTLKQSSAAEHIDKTGGGQGKRTSGRSPKHPTQVSNT